MAKKYERDLCLANASVLLGMLRTQVQHLICLAVILGLIAADVSALPKCLAKDEDCRERRMHPDLPATRDTWQRVVEGENSNAFWITKGQQHIRDKFATRINTNKAKNVIVFLGDGMGLTTIAATRNTIGGEEQRLSFEHFPFTGLSKTYSVDKMVPDSACTATAYLSGVKAQEGTIGLSGNVPRGDCQGMLDANNFVDSIAKWAMDAGKWAGVVTTTRITHASPAGVYSHVADRDWEDDTEVNEACGKDSGVKDIADQLINGAVGSKLKFIMGGGRKHFKSARSDGRDLVQEYKNMNNNNVYVETRSELMKDEVLQAERVLGLFHESHLLYHMETDESTDQPTLEEMTRKAIEYLSRNEEGYFIFIEGGRIDLAHHDNMARIALDETVEFSKAVKAARELTSADDTLIIVTADHSHAFSFSGYPNRGNDIFGAAPANPEDNMPYMTLSYANGPSYEQFYDTTTHKRMDPTKVLNGEAHDAFPATLPLEWETHGGDDVPVYASGPWSHLFTGVYEQNTLPHMMAYASCLGTGLSMCRK